MKKKWLVIVALIVVLAGVLYTSLTTVDVKSEEKLIAYIAKQLDDKPNRILKTASQGDYFAVLYSGRAGKEMMYFEKNLIGRYQYSGGGSSSEDISTYNYNEANSWSLIIVYGDNRNIKAASYEFESNNRKYGKSDLEDYILDIYIIEDTNMASSTGYLFDEQGNELEIF